MRRPLLPAAVRRSCLVPVAVVLLACGVQRSPPAQPPAAEVTLSPLARGAPTGPRTSASEPIAAPDAAAASRPSAEPPDGATTTAAAEEGPIAGLDLLRIQEEDGRLVAPTADGVAELTLDVDLQRIARRLIAARHMPAASVVLVDVATGHLLVYASRSEGGPPRDGCVEASAPSASVFKIVTAAALVEDAHLGSDTKQCYSGGEQRITATDLVDDPVRDKWCTTLAGALGHSVNTAFARLAKAHLSAPQLEAMARRFGYGQALPFDVPVEPSAVHVPVEPLAFARTAAGFWNTRLSPLHAAEMSAIVARGGESLRPTIVAKIAAAPGGARAPEPAAALPHRAIAPETAEQLTVMMERTVSEGTSWHAFHDAHGAPFLPAIAVAGKTGTLSDPETHHTYTWFTGFAPSRPPGGEGQVAIATLVVNGPTWQIKANVLARDVLRAYFAARGAKGVTSPSVRAT